MRRGSRRHLQVAAATATDGCNINRTNCSTPRLIITGAAHLCILLDWVLLHKVLKQHA